MVGATALVAHQEPVSCLDTANAQGLVLVGVDHPALQSPSTRAIACQEQLADLAELAVSAVTRSNRRMGLQAGLYDSVRTKVSTSLALLYPKPALAYPAF